jgi:deoxyadenosine/deoxycytidine kinase
MKLSQQKIIIIDGPVGAGKTTLSRILHYKFKRTALLSVDHIKWLVSDFAKTKKEETIANDIVLGMCASYFKYGFSVILERSFLYPGIINPFLKLARKNHIAALVYQLEASRKILMARVRRRPINPEVRCNTSLEKYRQKMNLYFKHKYSHARLIINSNRFRPKQIMELVLNDIKSA